METVISTQTRKVEENKYQAILTTGQNEHNNALSNYQHRSIHKRDTGKQHELTSELLFRNPDIEEERPPESYQIYKQRKVRSQMQQTDG